MSGNGLTVVSLLDALGGVVGYAAGTSEETALAASQVYEASAPPTQTAVEFLKEFMAARVKEVREVAEADGVLIGGNLYETSFEAQVKYLGSLLFATRDTAYSGEWKTLNNGYVTLDSLGVYTVCSGIMTYIQNCAVWEQDLLTDIAAATTVSQLQAIDFYAGKPQGSLGLPPPSPGTSEPPPLEAGSVNVADVVAETCTISGLTTSGSISTSGNITCGGAFSTATFALASVDTGAVTATSVTTTGATSTGSFSASGNATVAGTLGVTGATTLGTVSSGAATVTSLNAGSGTVVTTGALNGGSSTVTGNKTVGGTLGVTGATTLGTVSAGAATVTSLNAGAGTIVTTGSLNGGSSTITGNKTIGGTLGVTGAATVGSLNAGSGNIITTGSLNGGSSTITGNKTVGGTLGVTGAATVGSLNAGSGNIVTTGALNGGTSSITGNKTVGGTLGVTGAATVGSLNAGSGNIVTTGSLNGGSSSITGNNTVGGTLGVTGAATVGSLNAGSGTIITTGALNGGTSSITGNKTVGGTLGVTGTTTLGALAAGAATVASLSAGSGTISTTGAVNTGTIAATSNATVGGTLGVTGAATVGSLDAGSGTITTTGAVNGATSTITGNQSVGGTLGVTGAATVGSLNTVGNITTTTGFVGIGLTNPTSQLDLYNSVANTDTSFRLAGAGGASATSSLLFAPFAARAGGPSAIVRAVDNSYSCDIAFLNADSDGSGATTAVERMRIKTSGNVGIGTNNPQSRLEVAGTMTVTGLSTLSELTVLDQRLFRANIDGTLTTASTVVRVAGTNLYRLGDRPPTEVVVMLSANTAGNVVLVRVFEPIRNVFISASPTVTVGTTPVPLSVPLTGTQYTMDSNTYYTIQIQFSRTSGTGTVTMLAAGFVL